MKLLLDPLEWAWAVLRAWYGWVGGSATAGIIAIGHDLGIWRSPNRSVYFALLAIGFLISNFQAYRTELQAKRDEQSKNTKPEIRCDIKRAYIDGERFILDSIIGDKISSNRKDSFVTLDLSLENHRQVPTTIQEAQLEISHGAHAIVGEFIPEFMNHYVEENFPGNLTCHRWEPSLDIAIRDIAPLEYGRHKTCWARFHVKNLKADNYESLDVVLRLRDGLGEWHSFSKKVRFESGRMRPNS